MKKRKKYLSVLLMLALIMSLITETAVYAQEDNAESVELSICNDNSSLASSYEIGPDGNVYYYVGTAVTGNRLEVNLSQTIRTSEGWYIGIYCPNNNGRDLVDGTVLLTPVSGGSPTSSYFINDYYQVANINLNFLNADGLHRITIKASAVGDSGSVRVYYRLYQ